MAILKRAPRFARELLLLIVLHQLQNSVRDLNSLCLNILGEFVHEKQEVQLLGDRGIAVVLTLDRLEYP